MDNLQKYFDKAESNHINFQECLVYSRVVGFLTPVRDWNDGKQSEWKDRKVFRVPN